MSNFLGYLYAVLLTFMGTITTIAEISDGEDISRFGLLMMVVCGYLITWFEFEALGYVLIFISILMFLFTGDYDSSSTSSGGGSNDCPMPFGRC